MGVTIRRSLRDQYVDRLKGIVSPNFGDRKILIVGTGAGSYMAEKLARFSPRRIKLCDFDAVSVANLCRTNYRFEDAIGGKLKVDALADRIAEVNPLVEVVTYPLDITMVGHDILADMFEGVDLVVAGTDHFEAQSLINRVACQRGIPAVFVGIHENAHGGRVVWTVPGLTPCYRCVARERFAAAARDGGKGLDLPSALGSLVDCQFIDMVALKVVVAILERGEESALGRFFESMGKRNDIVVRCDPEYGWGSQLWDALLSDLPKQPRDFGRELREVALLAMDTLWLAGERDPDCPVCGTSARAEEERA